MTRLETLTAALRAAFGDKLATLDVALGEVTIEVAAADHLEVATRLRDDPTLGFDQLIALSDDGHDGPLVRFWNSDGEAVGACGNGSRCVGWRNPWRASSRPRASMSRTS